MPTGTATVLSFLLSAVAGAEKPNGVSWRVEPGVGCPTSVQLQAAFGSHQDLHGGRDRVVAEVVLDRPTGGILGVRVVTFTDPPFDVRREIRTREDSSCHELAETVALLVDAWLRGLPELAPRAVATQGEPTRNPAPAPNRAAEAPTASVKQSPSPRAPAKRHPPFVGLALGGGALVGSVSAPAMSLGIDVRISPRFGVTASGTWIGDASVFDPPFGSVFLQRQLFELEGTMRLTHLGGFSLHVLTGPVLWHGRAESLGYPATRSADLLDPGLVAGARLEQHLIGALRLRGQLGGVALARSYSLSIDHPGQGPSTVGLLRNFALQASLGAAIDLF